MDYRTPWTMYLSNSRRGYLLKPNNVQKYGSGEHYCYCCHQYLFIHLFIFVGTRFKDCKDACNNNNNNINTIIVMFMCYTIYTGHGSDNEEIGNCGRCRRVWQNIFVSGLQRRWVSRLYVWTIFESYVADITVDGRHVYRLSIMLQL